MYPPDGDEESGADDPPLSSGTIQYLEASALSSFKRQEDLDESVWRSLPFFAAAFGLALTMLGRLFGAMPHFGGVYAMTAYVLLGLATLSFLWAFRWFWSVVWIRDYRYPAAEDQLQNYAMELTAFHAGEGNAGDALEAAVLNDLRLFRMAELAAASAANMRNNSRRLIARGQAMLFTLIGFLLAFGCGALIFTHTLLNRSAIVTGATDVSTAKNTVAPPAPANAPATALSGGRRKAFPSDLEA